MEIAALLTQEQVVERLLVAAAGRREYARTLPSSRNQLEQEAHYYEIAAEIAAGNLTTLTSALPARCWTTEMHAAVDAVQDDLDQEEKR